MESSRLDRKLIALVFSLIGLSVGLNLVNHRQLINKKAASSVPASCSNIKISISPLQETYIPNTPLSFTISGYTPSSGLKMNIHYIRTPQDSSAWPNTNWTLITSKTGLTTPTFQFSWSPPNALSYPNQKTTPYPTPTNRPDPYNQSDYQEFFVSVDVLENGKFICTGNPNTGPDPQYLSLKCENCRKLVVTKPDLGLNPIDLNPYVNIKPGYSITYEGHRYDNPLDESGKPVSGDFFTRMEYEAPVVLCPAPYNYTYVPQDFTKSKRWGYWGTALPTVASRNNHMWTSGYTNVRIFMTSQDYTYPWKNAYQGYPGFKLYDIAPGIPDASTMTFPLNFSWKNYIRTFIDHSLDNENQYYVPYLITLDKIKSSGITSFSRIDSLYSDGNTPPVSENPNDMCKPRTKISTHSWNVRYMPLTNPELLNTFTTIRNQFPGKKIIVASYFEAPNASEMTFREDTYLMENVGIVGVDQAFYPAGSEKSFAYYTAPLMKLSSATPPHMTARAIRTYVGEPLEISYNPPISPPGGTYVLKAVSKYSRIPYDGYLEYEDSKGVAQPWKNIDGSNVWLENGQVTITLPINFPKVTINTRFRPKISTTPSSYEKQQPYNPMPWSNNVTQTIK